MQYVTIKEETIMNNNLTKLAVLSGYEGRYGVEDTRRAVQEARRTGITVFGITIDLKAKDYFPVLFGRGGYAIVGDAMRLPAALPAIYRRLACG
jgi:nitric oxide reductase NorD protein